MMFVWTQFISAASMGANGVARLGQCLRAAIRQEQPLLVLLAGWSRPAVHGARGASSSAGHAAGPGPLTPDPFQDKLRGRAEEQLLRMVQERQRAMQQQQQGDGAAQPKAAEQTAADQDEEDEQVYVNAQTGEVDGPKGKEPTRYGDWERRGRCTDF